MLAHIFGDCRESEILRSLLRGISLAGRLILLPPFLWGKAIAFLESLGEIELVRVAALRGYRLDRQVGEAH